MIRYLITALLVICFTGCSGPLVEREYPEYEKSVMVNFPTEEISQVVWEYAAELKYDKRLYIEHAFECVNDETILHIHFKTQLLIELCQARDLVVDVVEGLLDRLNNSPASKLLSPFPLTPNQIHITIDFQSYHGLYVDPFYIGWVVVEDGMVYFYAFNLKDKTRDFWNARSEPYFKSKSFVHWEREGEKLYEQRHPKHGHTFIPERYMTQPR